IHPSTLEIMHELGLLEAFLRVPHQELRTLAGLIGDTRITLADFTHLPTRCKFVALMPQWDFLNFMAEHANAYPAFKLMMRAEAVQQRGLSEFRATVLGLAPWLGIGSMHSKAGMTSSCSQWPSTGSSAGTAPAFSASVTPPCDVPHRRRQYQSRHPGCRRGGQ